MALATPPPPCSWPPSTLTSGIQLYRRVMVGEFAGFADLVFCWMLGGGGVMGAHLADAGPGMRRARWRPPGRGWLWRRGSSGVQQGFQIGGDCGGGLVIM